MKNDISFFHVPALSPPLHSLGVGSHPHETPENWPQGQELGQQGGRWVPGTLLAKVEVLPVDLGISLCRSWLRPTINHGRGWRESSNSHSCSSYKKLWKQTSFVYWSYSCLQLSTGLSHMPAETSPPSLAQEGHRDIIPELKAKLKLSTSFPWLRATSSWKISFLLCCFPFIEWI